MFNNVTSNNNNNCATMYSANISRIEYIKEWVKSENSISSLPVSLAISFFFPYFFNIIIVYKIKIIKTNIIKINKSIYANFINEKS